MDLLTIRTYNELAEEYDKETTGFWEHFPHRVFDKFIAETKGKVLDVGSGPGRDGLVLKNAGLDVVCLDASKSMIELSEAKGLKSVLGDFDKLPFSSRSFDGVWAYTSLLHTPKSKIKEPLMEINRVLKKNGIFGLGLIEGETELYRESSGVGKPRWFSFYKKEEIEVLLLYAGFEVIYYEDFQVNTKKYLNFICRKLPIAPRIKNFLSSILYRYEH
ncbi:MAG: class I SAM-dependent methyltransferase [Patescibacteria group bacterium]